MSVGSELFDRATRALLEALVAAGAEVPFLMQALVEENMLTSSLARGTVSTEDKLHKGKGALSRALIPGKPGNIYEKDVNLFASTFEYGVDGEVIKYAAIHEFGGVISITPKMRRFFWARYFETKQEMWRNLALTKKTQIIMPARPYMGPATEEFAVTELPSLLSDIYARMVLVFNVN